jgi:hypothetical protein
MIVERSFSEGLRLNGQPTGMGLARKSFSCGNCGAETLVEPDTPAFRCSFCGSDKVNEKAFDQRTIQPSGLLPFSIAKSKALEQFQTWIGRGWFHPNDLQKLATLDKIHGVYVPFWTYDAHTHSQWWAEAGYHYYETQSYTDANGNRQTRQVQKTRWVPVNGHFGHFFDDVLVIGSQGINQSRIEKIYPFDLKQVVNYDSHFLIGWEAEVYQRDVQQGFETAEGIMDRYIEREIIRQIPGDTHRGLRIHTRKDHITFKHLLLPVWIAAYIYRSKSYQVVLNGQTGAISGEKPLSAWKIALAVIFGLVAILTIWYFVQGKG